MCICMYIYIYTHMIHNYTNMCIYTHMYYIVLYSNNLVVCVYIYIYI